MKKNEEASALISGIGWSFAQRFLPQIVTLLVSIVLARILSPEHYGVISIVSVFIALGDAVAAGGFGNALVQKKDTDNLDFNSICWVSLFISMLIYTVLYISAAFMAKIYGLEILIPVIRIFGISVIFSAFNSVQMAYVQKKMMFREAFLSTIGGVLVSAVIGIAMAVAGCGIWALVAQQLSNTIIKTVSLFLLLDWRPAFEVSRERVKRLWNYGAKVLGATLIYTLRDNLRTLLVGKQFSSSELAYYNQGQKYPALLVTDIVTSMGTVLFPTMSKNQMATEKVKDLMRTAIRISSYILLPVMAGLFAVGDTFVKVILTDKWLPCVPFLRIMCLFYATRSVSVIYQTAILSVGKSNLNLIHEAINSVLTIIVLIVSVFVFKSITVMAFSQVAVMVIGVSLYAIWVREYFDYNVAEMLADFFPPAIMSCIMAIAVLAVGRIPMQEYVCLIVQMLTGVIVYIVLSVVSKDSSYRWIKSYIVRNMQK